MQHIARSRPSIACQDVLWVDWHQKLPQLVCRYVCRMSHTVVTLTFILQGRLRVTVTQMCCNLS